MQQPDRDQYGVFGHPVGHSWSPFIHGLFARQTGHEIVYRLYDVPLEQFRRRAIEFFTSGGLGLNITVPLKQAAAEFATELTPRAERAGAANTLAKQGEKILGDNTDGAGLVRDLRDNLSIDVANRSVLILGAGGATRGVVAPLLSLAPAEIVIANRTAARARTLAEMFSDLGSVRGCGFDELGEREFDIVVNATSTGLQEEMPAIPAHVVGRGTFCYDMMYGKQETPFTRWSRQRGCARVEKGWGMLVEQAAESFLLWRGVRPQTGPVLAALTSRNAP
jgi:shikimate dehydrogenase